MFPQNNVPPFAWEGGRELIILHLWSRLPSKDQLRDLLYTQNYSHEAEIIIYSYMFTQCT